MNSSRASSAGNGRALFHHFQLVSRCSSTALCIMAVHSAEILPSVSGGYLPGGMIPANRRRFGKIRTIT